MKIKYTIIFAFILAMIPASYAFAHKVIIFAWVEDGMIHTESSFGSKDMAKNCTISVFDENGRLVHQGISDQEGKYSFKIPEKIDSDLILKLDAGTAHQAKWKLSKKELMSTPSKKDIEKVMKEKEEIEKAPSFFKIFGGIFIIFLLAMSVKFLKRKKILK